MQDKIAVAQVAYDDVLIGIYEGLEFVRTMAAGERSIRITDDSTGNRWICTFEEKNQ
jgi:hypothetical protein